MELIDTFVGRLGICEYCGEILVRDYILSDIEDYDPYQAPCWNCSHLTSMASWGMLVDPNADAVLLIVAILGDPQLHDLIEQARELEMESLVEVHDEAEVERALKAGADLIGINNRDLHSFEVDLATTERQRLARCRRGWRCHSR